MDSPVVVMGIDGGASSTTCMIAESTGRVLGVGRGGPIDHLYRPTGVHRTRESLGEAISIARRAARLRRPPMSVVAGLTGLEPDSPESQTAVRIIRGLIRAERVRAVWDVEIAFEGAASGGPSIMVIAGTGSVAFGRNASGQTARAGGYGFLIDDAGGGVSIGRLALQAALSHVDGRGPATRLVPIIRRRLGGWREIRQHIYGGDGRAVLASLVPVVAKAAREGDRVANRILREAGRSLAQLVLAVATQLKMNNESFGVFPVGGVFTLGRLLRDPLRAALRTGAARSRIRDPRYPPVVGAVLLAFDQAGVKRPVIATRG